MKIKELFSGPEKWTKHAAAEDRLGTPCSPSSPNATAFCLLGAISRCYADDEDEERAVMRKLVLEIGNGPISWWNDHPDRKFEEVKYLVERLGV
jgi:hypothetical protein